MASYGKSSKRQKFFQQFQDMQQHLTDNQTATNLQCYENEGTSGSSQPSKQAGERKPNSARQKFFENFQNSQLLTNHDSSTTLQCGQNEGTSGLYPYSVNTYDADTIMTDAVVCAVPFGQASYQKNRQGMVVGYEDCGDNSFVCNHCGAYFWIGEAMKNSIRKKNNDPIYTACCHKGEVKIPFANPTPIFLQQLLNPENGRESMLFRENIRVYNSMFAFTSMGAKIDRDINKRSGPYVFKICGQVHHLMGSALPIEGEPPKYAQLYVYDTSNEISNRMNAIDPSHVNKKTKPDIVQGLMQMFDETNELVKQYRNVRDKFEDSSLPAFNTTILGRQPTDGKQYGLPTGDQIAGLIVGDIGQFNSNRDIIIQSNDGSLKRISKLHPKYMSLQYPLLFPYGENGYRLGLELQQVASERGKTRIKLTMIKFICYQIHDRQNDASTLLKGGRLFQQYLVDAYATVEEDRIEYARNNQPKLRSEIRKNIYAAVSTGIQKTCDVGRQILLPSSHTGGPRDMINNYQDAMAICRQYGNPDLFITFTCNVNWPEITRYFKNKPGYRHEDRPDIISRIFKLKLEDMLAYIKSGQPFGQVEADVCTIEFQKRGLPHAHMLFWLKRSYKCHNPTDIDSIISAELPDKNISPELFAIVGQFMIHGPCGKIDPKAPCMQDGKCTKRFPKKYKLTTKFEAIKPPVYKRRDDDTKFVVKNKINIGNNYVVPYNSNLLLRYNAHINVESCSQSMLIKYLFKYINKGPDRARVSIYENIDDEIQNYLNCRYLAPHESVWRLFEFSIHSRHPAVQLLQVHMPTEQNVVFKETDSLESVLQNPITEITMFTRWLEKNAICEEARELTYAEFPTKFVWDAKTKCWMRRQRYQTIGRIAHVPPIVGELYYMRKLLNIQKGCRNYREIRTVNGVTYDSYQEACRALGLLDDDKEWIDALTESSFTATSNEMRRLFVTIILFCNVSNPQALLDAHWINMSDDILYKIRSEFNMPNLTIPEPELKNSLLFELEKIFSMSSTSLENFQLPMPSADQVLQLNNKLLREERDYDCDALKMQHSNLITKLNGCQKIIYDEAIKAVQEKNCKSFFVHGCGGTGKTFLWHTIITRLRSEGKIVLAVASSGIASLLLSNGRTAHSRFKIPLKVNKLSTCAIKKGTHLAKLLEKTELIIWDEAPMANKYCFESLDTTLRDILSEPRKPFGGISILLGGDFRQILPVVSEGTKEKIIEHSLNNSFLWPSLQVFSLTENMRLSRSGLSNEEKHKITNFANWILQIGDGRVQSIYDTDDRDTSWINIPKDLLTQSTTDPIGSIFLATYPDFNIKYNNADYLKERAIITPRNITANDINNYVINLLPGDKKTYFSSDTISFSSGSNKNSDFLYPTEFLNKLEFSGMPTHELVLKVGMPIMLLRNLNQIDGLCNGTRLIITKLYDRLIEAEILTGKNITDKVFIPRIVMTTVEDKWPFTFKRRQFPIRPCYAMTINKSQGQSLNQVGIYLSEPVFTHGQLYVALSRVTSKEGLKILINNSDDIPNNCTKNIVYKDVLYNI